MSVLVKDIERLNKKIDDLIRDKTRADAQKEMWVNRLKDSLKTYESSYGVGLDGENIVEIKKKLEAEFKKVEKKTNEEYEKSLKIVSLIESGDINGAWLLMGVDVEAERKKQEEVARAKEEAERQAQVEAESASATEEAGLQGIMDAFEDIEDGDFFGSEDNGDIYVEEGDEDTPDEDDDFVAQDFVDEEEVPEEPKKDSKGSFLLMDDDDEDDFIPVKKPSKAPVKGTPAKETKESGSISLDDEDEDDDMYGSFGGFGSILKGSKFMV